jgi:hypothetical protein
MNKIFFSWQSDIPGYKSCLIKCIKLAIADLDDWELETAERDPEGADDIAVVILEKIDKSALFVGDVSLVGEYRPYGAKDDEPARKTINPNVSYEVGYALHRLTKNRVILLAARETTPDTKELPFDVRNRRTMLRSFDDTKAKALARELKEIILRPRPALVIEEPYVFIKHIGGWSAVNGHMMFEFYNEEPTNYLLESIEINGATLKVDRDLDKDGAITKMTLVGLPIPPYDTKVETVSFVISRLGKRYKVTQKLEMSGMAIGKFNLDKVVPAPLSIESLQS